MPLLLRVLLIALLAVPSAMADSAAPKHRTHLDELFIWKMSEELKLPPEEELKFSEIISGLNAQKRELYERLDEAVKKLAQANGTKAAEAALTAHRKLIGEQQALQTKELDSLRSLLGAERMAKYLVAKNELTERLKAMLTTPQGGEASRGGGTAEAGAASGGAASSGAAKKGASGTASGVAGGNENSASKKSQEKKK